MFNVRTDRARQELAERRARAAAEAAGNTTEAEDDQSTAIKGKTGYKIDEVTVSGNPASLDARHLLGVLK